MFEDNEVEDNETFWISYTDLVTGFMAIFLVITFILMGQKTETKVPEPEQQGRYIELVDVFQKAFKSYDNIQVTEDGTVRFFNKSKNGEVLFENADPHLTSSFQSILSKFIPVYYEEVNKIYIKHPNLIKEIRIEGHTSSPGGYDSNLKLSTLRAYYVSQFITKSYYIGDKDPDFQEFIRDNTIACGYSSTRTLNKDGNYAKSLKEENEDFSRRVEFRLILEAKPKK